MKSKSPRTDWRQVHDDLVTVANQIANEMNSTHFVINYFICNHLSYNESKKTLRVFKDFFEINGSRTANNMIWHLEPSEYPKTAEVNDVRLMMLAVLIEYSRMKANKK